MIAVAEVVRVSRLVLCNGGKGEDPACEPRHGQTRGRALAGRELFGRRTVTREFDAAAMGDPQQIQGSAGAGVGEVGDGDQRLTDRSHLARIVRNGGNGREGLRRGCGEFERAQRHGLELP